MGVEDKVVRASTPKASRAQYYHDWYVKNLEANYQKRKAYYYANRDKILTQQKEYRRGRRNSRITSRTC